MKTIIILGDGMADEPIGSLGGLTPLQYAKTPWMDRLASEGVTGRLQTVPLGYHPGSEVANLSVLGYNLGEVFEGRGVLEAAAMGVELRAGELALRCNLICVEGGRIKNHSAGHISTAEAGELVDYLNAELAGEYVKIYKGVSYRHLLVMKGGDKRLACTPPHDVPGASFEGYLVKPEAPEASWTASELNKLIHRSQELLASHPVNVRRVSAGKDAANSIWPWSPGYRPAMQTLSAMYGFKSGAVISAVDLIRGIGVYAGLRPIYVEGATGLYDTNYEGKASAAVAALAEHEFVYLHVEASDEAGHEGDVGLKIRTIENLDSRVVGPVYESVQGWKEGVAIAVLPDHPTPCALRTHTSEAVPFVIYKPGCEADEVRRFDEKSVEKGGYGQLAGAEFMGKIVSRR
ncbi:MAG: cofactor-independent phosphoglycerate mutase [Tannerellaceae bacterium]|jgi:2,3-bisphosphoglycerate-independent phosphoglycerate mutase|nr:cofactor-independent phosphoglycerate mutase [Tannerellaceae bacterium]